MTTDRPLLGISLMLGFCALAPLSDSLAKLLGTDMSVGMMITIRFCFQTLLLVPLALALRMSLALSRRALVLTGLRSLCHIAGIGLMFSALQYLPLADAVSIAFVMPFILLFLGWAVLGESVGPHRIGAALVGFVGTLFVLRPNLAAVGLVALLPLGVAFVFACFMLFTRALAREAGAIEMQAVSGVMAAAVMLPVLFFGPDIAFLATSRPDAATLWLVVAMGSLGTLAHLLMTWSLRFAPTATLAPMQYLEIPVAACLGWLIFSDLPAPSAVFGICLTVAAGLYIIAREQRASRTQPGAPEPQIPAPPAA